MATAVKPDYSKATNAQYAVVFRAAAIQSFSPYVLYYPSPEAQKPTRRKGSNPNNNENLQMRNIDLQFKELTLLIGTQFHPWQAWEACADWNSDVIQRMQRQQALFIVSPPMPEVEEGKPIIFTGYSIDYDENTAKRLITESCDRKWLEVTRSHETLKGRPDVAQVADERLEGLNKRYTQPHQQFGSQPSTFGNMGMVNPMGYGASQY